MFGKRGSRSLLPLLCFLQTLPDLIELSKVSRSGHVQHCATGLGESRFEIIVRCSRWMEPVVPQVAEMRGLRSQVTETALVPRVQASHALRRTINDFSGVVASSYQTLQLPIISEVGAQPEPGGFASCTKQINRSNEQSTLISTDAFLKHLGTTNAQKFQVPLGQILPSQFCTD